MGTWSTPFDDLRSAWSFAKMIRGPEPITPLHAEKINLIGDDLFMEEVQGRVELDPNDDTDMRVHAVRWVKGRHLEDEEDGFPRGCSRARAVVLSAVADWDASHPGQEPEWRIFEESFIVPGTHLLREQEWLARLAEDFAHCSAWVECRGAERTPLHDVGIARTFAEVLAVEATLPAGPAMLVAQNLIDDFPLIQELDHHAWERRDDETDMRPHIVAWVERMLAVDDDAAFWSQEAVAVTRQALARWREGRPETEVRWCFIGEGKLPGATRTALAG